MRSDGIQLLLDKRKRAVSKWKKINNTIKFINISKDCAKKTKRFKNTSANYHIDLKGFMVKKTLCVAEP